MGLQYLHGVSILHGGLKGSNVLVNEEGSAVLSDFSLSKIMEPDSSFTMSNGLQADLRWMAPEAQSQQIMSSSTDVYAWAMTALEIVSGRECAPGSTWSSANEWFRCGIRHSILHDQVYREGGHRNWERRSVAQT